MLYNRSVEVLPVEKTRTCTHTHKHEQVGLTPFPASVQQAQVFISQTNGIPAVRSGLRSVDPDVLEMAGNTPDR